VSIAVAARLDALPWFIMRLAQQGVPAQLQPTFGVFNVSLANSKLATLVFTASLGNGKINEAKLNANLAILGKQLAHLEQFFAKIA